MFKFKCENCETPETYFVTITGSVTCGSCYNIGEAVELTAKEIKALDLPTPKEA